MMKAFKRSKEPLAVKIRSGAKIYPLGGVCGLSESTISVQRDQNYQWQNKCEHLN